VSPGDVEGIAAAAARLLADEPRRAALAEAARRRVEADFSVEAMVRRTCALYEPAAVSA
jgi:glycosyltransferase involved in cell wall biosynthesis